MFKEALNGAFKDGVKLLQERATAKAEAHLKPLERLEPKREHGVHGIVLRWTASVALLASYIPIVLVRSLDIEPFKLGARLTGSQQEQKDVSLQSVQNTRPSGQRPKAPNPFKH